MRRVHYNTACALRKHVVRTSCIIAALEYSTGMEVNVEKLRELREDRALSMRELAERSGVAHQTIYRIERGQKNVLPRTVRRLAAALGVEPKELRPGR